jgi:hypothetical protein
MFLVTSSVKVSRLFYLLGLLCLFFVGLTKADSLKTSQTLAGGVGLVSMPTARMVQEGSFGVHFSKASPYGHYVVFAQPLPWLEVLFKYTDIENRIYGISTQSYKDKSTDVKVRLNEESYLWPAISLGIRDVGGTGFFSSEYVVASKQLGRFDLSLGLGWGYLGNQAQFSNPLCSVFDSFCQRDSVSNQGGTFGVDNFFSGKKMAVFGGLEYHQADWPIIWKVEYDANNYQNEPQNNNLEQKTPFNIGLLYHYKDSIDVQIGVVRGTTLALGVTLKTNLKKGAIVKYLDPKPEVVSEITPIQEGKVNWQVVEKKLQKMAGLQVDQVYKKPDEVIVKGRQKHYIQTAKGIGRASRLLANAMPSEVKKFTFVEAYNGVDVSSVTVNRLRFERLARLEQPQKQIISSTQFEPTKPIKEIKPVFVSSRERLKYKISPGFSASYGGPDAFVLYQASIRMDADYYLRKNTWVSGGVELGLIDNYDQFDYTAPSNLPRVRTNIKEYLKTSKLRLNNLQLLNIESTGQNLFYMGYLGYLESMYGGVGGEVLYRPYGKRWALGLDVNYVKQREFDQRFAFRDYEVLTGHLTGYYETKDNLAFKVSTGRYLAKDRGVTIDISRKFKNSAKMGFWATKTNVSAEDFGEGSFDKGFYVSIPFNLFTFKSTTDIANLNWQFLTRDGGQKLNRRYELYDITNARRLDALKASFDEVLH